MLTPSLLPLLTFGLLLSLVRSLQDRRSVSSAKATAVSATVIEFEWGEIVHPSDGLKAFLLRGVSGSGEISVKLDPKKRKGRLTNLKPFTNYNTSVISLYSDSNATTNAGVVLTWSAAPSPPNLTSALASGSRSIALSWTVPEISNGILEGYSVECYRPGDSYPEGSKRVSANTLSVEITGLRANTLFECAVIASTKEIRWGQGGGKSASARSSLIRTWPGITEQPIIKNATAVGPDSVFLEWWKVNNVYGILGHYRVSCSQDGQKDSVKSVQVLNDTLSAKLSGLIPNTRYKCTVEAFVLPNEENLGGGYSQPSFGRSPKTWPDVPTEPIEIAVTAVSSTAVKIDWKAPLTPNGDISKYRVVVYEGSQNLSYETGPGALSYLLDGLQPYTTTALAVQAYTKPNDDGFGGGFGKVSPAVSVTTKEAAPGPVQLLSCIHAPPGSPRLACSWSSPLVHNGIVRKYAVQLMDLTSHRVVSNKVIEDTYVTFKEAFDFTHVYQVSVAAVTVLEGEKTNVTVQLRTSNSSKSLDGLGATEETIVGAKATDPNYIMDEEGPAGSHGNITETNLSGSHDNLGGTSTAVPIESNEEDTPQKEVFSPAEIAVTVCGIISLMALAVGIYLLIVRRRRRSVLNVNVDAEENDTSVLGVKPAPSASQVQQSV
ncbi:hypothetical protein AAHC03_022751 [Spirometra sp. Aus1]